MWIGLLIQLGLDMVLSLYIVGETVMLTYLGVYFIKGLNVLITSSFYWFIEYVSPLNPEVSLIIVCYGIMNFIIDLKRVLQKKKRILMLLRSY